MKRYYFFLQIVIAACGCLLSSCIRSEDTNQSMALSGEWRGDFGMYYNYTYRGRTYTFDSYDSRIRFVPDYRYANHGVGTQVDYYEEGPYEYQYYSFTWSVRNGVIYLYYDYDPGLDTRISDYHMTNDYLRGTFSETGTQFRLYKMADFYSWTPYVNTYGYGPRTGWNNNYPGTRSADSADADDESADDAGQVLSRGRRLN